MSSSLPRRGLTLLVVTGLLLGMSLVTSMPRAAADPLGECTFPPTVEPVSAGLTGAIDPPHGQGLSGSVYLKYGYAGQVWHVFDAGEGKLTACVAMTAEISTWLGNQLFSAAKTLVAVTNSLHYAVYGGGLSSLADSFDQIIKTGVTAAYEGFAAPFLVLALLLVGIAVFWYVMRGDTAGAAKSGARVAFGLTMIAATAFSPLLYTHLFDNLLIGGFKQAQQQVQNALVDKEGVVYRHVLPTKLHHEIVYENWLRGEFGSADSELAENLGRKLVWAQACSWHETRTDSCNVEAKHEQFKEIAKKIKESGNYATFTGEDGSRIGIGALALFEAAVITPLQIVSKLGILFGQIVLRLAVLFGPVLGILAMAPGVGRRILKGVLGVGALALFMTIIATLHSYLVLRILNTDMPLVPRLIVITIITLLIWAVARPVKRVKGMMASSMYAMPGQGLHRAADWLQHTRMMRAMRKKPGRSQSGGVDTDFWLSKDTVATPPRSGGTDSPAATGTRPEAAASARGLTAAPAALPAASGSGTAGGSRAAGTGGPPAAPAGPPGSSPAGSGAAVMPPGREATGGEAPPPPPIRAEATRLWEPDGTVADTSPSEPAQLDTTRSAPALPAGIGSTEPAQDDKPPEADRAEVVVPSEILPPAQEPQSQEEPPPRSTGLSGGQVFRVASNQVEPDPGPQRPDRPETRNADEPGGTPQEGEV